MKKSSLILLPVLLLILSGCQSSPDHANNAANRSNSEKAVSSTQVNLTVRSPDDSNDNNENPNPEVNGQNDSKPSTTVNLQ